VREATAVEIAFAWS